MRQAQPYVDASWQLLGSIGLCALAGWWLDGRFGTRPWFLVAGALFGLVSGMLAFWRVVQRLADKQPKREFEIRDVDDSASGWPDTDERKRRRPPPPEGFDLSRPNGKRGTDGKRGAPPRNEDA